MSQRQVIVPRFQVLRRGEVIRVVPVHRSRLIVGSEEGAHLRLKHPAIAARHLEVNVVGGRYIEAANLAGEGRVLLGNQPMNRARLREGDELDLGPVSLRLTYQRPEPSRPEAVVPASPALREPEDEPTVDEPAPEATDGPPPGSGIDTGAEPPLSPVPDDEPTEAGASVPGPSPAPVPSPPAEHLAHATTRPVAPVAPTGLGPRASTTRKAERAAPFSPSEPVGVDVDLDEIVLDPTPVVVIEPPGGRPQRVPLRVGSFVVGAGRCAFRLSYPGVAPAHTEMMVMPDGAVYLKHLAGSGLLTLRNGAPVQFSRWNSGDRLQVGPVSMRLQMEQRAAAIDTTPTRVGRSHALAGEPARPDEMAVPDAPRPRGSSPGQAQPQPDSPIAPLAEDEPTLAGPAAAPAGPAPIAVEATAAPQAPPPPEPSPTLPATEPASPVASPLVRVHARTSRPAAKRPLARSASPLVTTHTVQVQLDVSSRETFASFQDDEAEYRRPLRVRALPAVLIAALLLVILWQAALLFGTKKDDRESPPPRTADGASGLPGKTRGSATAIGSGIVTVGDPEEILEARRRRVAGQRAGGSGDDGGDIDWDGTGRVRSGSGRSFSTEHETSLSGARVADDIEAAREAAAPPHSTSGEGEGFVDMKEVDRAIYGGGRKLRYCYEQARIEDDTLAGIMWATLTLGVDGRIRGVVTESRSSLVSEPLRACLERQIYSLEMPAPKGGPVTFSYPFKFDPTE